MENMVAFEGGPDGSGGFVIVVLADGAHFFICYFVDFTFIAAYFVSFDKFFMAMHAEIQLTEIVFGQFGNECGGNKKWIGSFFGSGGRCHNIGRFA